MPDLAPRIGRQEDEPTAIAITAALMLHMLNRPLVEPDELAAIGKLDDDTPLGKCEMVSSPAL